MKIFLLLLVLVVTFVSGIVPSHKNYYRTPEEDISIGDTCCGGIVFWVAPLTNVGNYKRHGLVCSMVEQSGGISWCRDKCYRIGNLVTDVGMGEAGITKPGGGSNTKSIGAEYGDTLYAANLCRTLTLNGYSDWFLPSRDELNLMYANLRMYGLGHFAKAYYWSSSECNEGMAPDTNLVWAQFFGNGGQKKLMKIYSGSVRAVRTF